MSIDLTNMKLYKKNTEYGKFSKILTNGNNIPMQILKFWIEYQGNVTLKNYDDMIEYIMSLYALKKEDVNHKNDSNETIVSFIYLLFKYTKLNSEDEKEKKLIILIRTLRELSLLGYTEDFDNYKSVLEITQEAIDVVEGKIQIQSKTLTKLYMLGYEILMMIEKPNPTGKYVNKIYLAAGGFGQIFTARDGSEVSVIKMVADEKNMPDLFKEYNISRTIGSEVCVTMKMLRENAKHSGIYELIMEYLPYTLFDYITFFRGYTIDFFRDILISFLSSSIQKMGLLNQMGFLHMDVKPENIGINGNGEVRLIDFGLVEFNGVSKYKEQYFSGTVAYSPPEWDYGNSARNYVYNNKVVFRDPQKNKICYSSDLYAIVNSFTSILGWYDCRTLIPRGPKDTKLYCSSLNLENYYFKTTVGIFENTEQDIFKVSPHYMDFLIRGFCHNSYKRMVCREAYDHPLFGGNNCDAMDPVYGTISKMSYSSGEIACLQGSLKILSDFEEKISQLSTLRSGENINVTIGDLTYKYNIKMLYNMIDPDEKQILALNVDNQMILTQFRFLYGAKRSRIEDLWFYSLVLKYNYKIVIVDELIIALSYINLMRGKAYSVILDTQKLIPHKLENIFNNPNNTVNIKDLFERTLDEVSTAFNIGTVELGENPRRGKTIKEYVYSANWDEVKGAYIRCEFSSEIDIGDIIMDYASERELTSGETNDIILFIRFAKNFGINLTTTKVNNEPILCEINQTGDGEVIKFTNDERFIFSKRNGNRYNIIKYLTVEKDRKSAIISNQINMITPNVVIDEKIIDGNIIIDDVLMTFEDYIKMVRGEDQFFSEFLNIVENILIDLEIIHSLGYLHTNLVPSNIYINSRMVAKIGGFENALFLGMEKNDSIGPLSLFSSPEQFRTKRYISDHGKVMFENDDYQISYSSDIYTFINSTFSLLFGSTYPMLLTVEKIYAITNSDLNSRTLKELNIPKLSNHSYIRDFLEKTLCQNANLRYTATQAKDHPLFSSEPQKTRLPYSITALQNFKYDIDEGNFRMSEGFELANRNIYVNFSGECKELDMKGDLNYIVNMASIYRTTQDPEIKEKIRNNSFVNEFYSLFEQGSGIFEEDFKSLQQELSTNRIIPVSSMINWYVQKLLRDGDEDAQDIERFYGLIPQIMKNISRKNVGNVKLVKIFEEFLSMVRISSENKRWSTELIQEMRTVFIHRYANVFIAKMAVKYPYLEDFRLTLAEDKKYTKLLDYIVCKYRNYTQTSNSPELYDIVNFILEKNKIIADGVIIDEFENLTKSITISPLKLWATKVFESAGVENISEQIPFSVSKSWIDELKKVTQKNIDDAIINNNPRDIYKKELLRIVSTLQISPELKKFVDFYQAEFKDTENTILIIDSFK